MYLMTEVNIIAFIISLLGMMSAYQIIRSGKVVECACMGTYWKLPMTKVTLLENGVMIVMILFMMLFPNTIMNMGSMDSDMHGMLMDKNTRMSSEMTTPSFTEDKDPMREHCKMMPEMAGCEKYR